MSLLMSAKAYYLAAGVRGDSYQSAVDIISYATSVRRGVEREDELIRKEATA
jgi:hypothetical protein